MGGSSWPCSPVQQQMAQMAVVLGVPGMGGQQEAQGDQVVEGEHLQ